VIVRLLGLGLLGGLDRGSVGLGTRGATCELLEETGGGLEGTSELTLGLRVPDVELGLVRLENTLEGGDRLDKELRG
jgi:hypothetical protein